MTASAMVVGASPQRGRASKAGHPSSRGVVHAFDWRLRQALIAALGAFSPFAVCWFCVQSLLYKQDMDKEATLKKLQEVFRDVFEDDELTLTPETSAQDVEGWDSLAHVSL